MKTVLVFVLGGAIGFVGGTQYSAPQPKPATYDRTIAIEAPPPQPKVEPPPPAPASAPVAVAKKTRVIKKQARVAQGPTPEDLVKAHESDSVDGDWSSATADKLQADFEKMDTSHSFAVSGIDCRSKSCLVSVEWDSFKHAEDSKDEIVGAAYSVACGKRLVAPPGKAKDGNFRATLLFYDCRR